MALVRVARPTVVFRYGGPSVKKNRRVEAQVGRKKIGLGRPRPRSTYPSRDTRPTAWTDDSPSRVQIFARSVLSKIEDRTSASLSLCSCRHLLSRLDLATGFCGLRLGWDPRRVEHLCRCLSFSFSNGSAVRHYSTLAFLFAPLCRCKWRRPPQTVDLLLESAPLASMTTSEMPLPLTFLFFSTQKSFL